MTVGPPSPDPGHDARPDRPVDPKRRLARDPVAPVEPPGMHPSLKPTGEHIAYSAVGSLLGGLLVWGGVGMLLDRWLETGRILTVVGAVAGFCTGFAIVYVRFGRDD